MTTSKMENPLWKKLRNDNDSLLLKTKDSTTSSSTPSSTNIDSKMSNLASTVNFLNLNSMQFFNEENDYSSFMNDQQQNSLKYLPLTSISTNKLAIKREIGFIEKILVTYGFIKCTDRDGRYFFHYSSYQGDPNDLKIGDIIEFEESTDKRTGKPIAINLTKSSTKTQQQQFFDSTQQEQLNLSLTTNNNNENFNNLLMSSLASSNQNLNSSNGYSKFSSLMKQKSLNSNNNLLQSLFNSQSSPTEIIGDQMYGTIAIPSKKDCMINGIVLVPPDGTITYQKNGETFYIPYAKNDINKPTDELRFGDKVKFLVVQNIATGFIYARKIELFQLNKPATRGIVTTCKDIFGKIEREDDGKEIFFHFSDYKGGNLSDLCVSANVEFEIQDRHGKEIACNIRLLPMGTVSFDEISKVLYIGRILKPLPTPNKTQVESNQSQGRIIFDFNEDKLVEIMFYERDRVGEFTFLEGDIVQFKVATDKRTKYKRAVEVIFMEPSLLTNKEKRECGIVDKVLSSNSQQNIRYGAIRSIERDELVYFLPNEFISSFQSIESGDCLEFTVVEYQKDLSTFKTGLKAIRIKQLPENSVKFETTSRETYFGTIEKEAVEIQKSSKSQDNSKLNSSRRLETQESNQKIQSSPVQQQISKNEDIKYEAGLIKFDFNDETKQIPFYSFNYAKSKNNVVLHYMDKVEFNLHTVIRDNKQSAVNVKLVKKHVEQGFITVLKENYGFIENLSQSKDIFFHYSSTTVSDLDIGDEVEFYLRKNGSKLNAENVVKLASGTIQTHTLVPYLYKGRILQPLRSINHEQEEFYGKLQVFDEGANADIYQFGFCGLSDKKMIILVGDVVTFQVGINKIDGTKKAFNVAKKEKELRKGKIDSIKSQYGFIDFSIGDSKKLIFYFTDLDNGTTQGDLKAGDDVEFNVSYNNRNSKYFANKVKKINTQPSAAAAATNNSEPTKRPERLITKLKASNIDDKSGKQLMLIRQPRNPDMKMKSFSKQRIERLPGIILNESADFTTAVVIATVSNKNEINEPKISHFNNLISQA